MRSNQARQQPSLRIDFLQAQSAELCPHKLVDGQGLSYLWPKMSHASQLSSQQKPPLNIVKLVYSRDLPIWRASYSRPQESLDLVRQLRVSRSVPVSRKFKDTFGVMTSFVQSRHCVEDRGANSYFRTDMAACSPLSSCDNSFRTLGCGWSQDGLEVHLKFLAD